MTDGPADYLVMFVCLMLMFILRYEIRNCVLDTLFFSPEFRTPLFARV